MKQKQKQAVVSLRRIRKRSPWPLLITAAVWAVLCLILPLYKLSSCFILLVAGAASYIGFSRVFPGETRMEELPEEPVHTGDEKIDALMAEGRQAAAEMKRLRSSIPEADIRAKLDKLIGLTEKIFQDLVEDPADYNQVRRFSNYYLPTTLKLLNAYDRMAAQEIMGNHVSGSMHRIQDMLDTLVDAYQKQLDSLFANQALDIETDITVLETMLRREGLSGSDFSVGTKRKEN